MNLANDSTGALYYLKRLTFKDAFSYLAMEPKVFRLYKKLTETEKPMVIDHIAKKGLGRFYPTHPLPIERLKTAENFQKKSRL